MSFRTLPKLVISIALCEFAGVLGSAFTFSAIPTWYATLVKPQFAPPNWIFGPVWTILYLLMGIAFYLVWTSRADARARRRAMAMFGIQLLLNAIWSPIFFGLQSPGSAFLVIILLWCAIIATMYLFSKVLRTAALLLLPYIAWVSFAAYLNYSIWALN